MSYKVGLTYFKPSGKYYSGAFYVSEETMLWKIWEEVGDMLTSGSLPGLVKGATDFIVLIEVPSHPHNHPHLLIPDEIHKAVKILSEAFGIGRRNSRR